jgi:hypothetical protein
MTQYVYEMNGGAEFGYFNGKYLYSMAGSCEYYRGGSDGKYLYKYNGESCEFTRTENSFTR